MAEQPDKANWPKCSQTGCKNLVNPERVEYGYDYCPKCGNRNPDLKFHKKRVPAKPVKLEGYDADELRRAW